MPLRGVLSFLITTMLVGASHCRAQAVQVTTQAPPIASSQEMPDDPGQVHRYPAATVVERPGEFLPVTIVSDRQSLAGTRYSLDGHVVITFDGRRVEADHISYDTATGELDAAGHLHVTGGRSDESIAASRGTLNTQTETGRFYDVTGSVGLKKTSSRQRIYSNGNPFLFSGRVVVKTGPESYDIYDGSVTSCALPHPDWLLSARRFSVADGKASARGSTFRLFNLPLVYLPYVTHATGSGERQTGFLIPVVGQSSSKGFILGEQVYFALNRSTDLTVGAEYFSSRGYSQLVNLRYRGLGNDFALARYTGLLDRQNGPLGTTGANQGGEDISFAGRHDFSPRTRAATNVEYLSSYVYREAFSESFNQAVSTDITSVAYLTHEHNGYETSVVADRYQGLKRVPTVATETAAAQAGQEIRLFHVPSLHLATTEHRIGGSGLLWTIDAAASGMKRVQPNFTTSGIVERLDLSPEISYPLAAGGWRLRPSFGVRETFYSRSRQTPYLPGAAPVELTSGLNRSSLRFELEARPPVLERTFRSPLLDRVFGGEVRHTVEPVLRYRYVTGINNFLNVLRFDIRDVASDTNELEYGVTQRLFVHGSDTASAPCREPTGGLEDSEAPLAEISPAATPARSAGESSGCQTRDLISWRLTQKYFFDDHFGGAVISGRRNIFETTLDLSGVAFLTEPRHISPLISRLRIRTSEHTDFQWDFDLDTGAKRFTSNVVLFDLHQGGRFAGVSYARLNAPGRSYVEGLSSLVADFNQLRFLLGYGGATKPGLGVAATVGLDLKLPQTQYAALQSSYNWNCCGVSVEYRKYELGSVRNENAYRFNFTLANVGSAGNLRRSQRLF